MRETLRRHRKDFSHSLNIYPQAQDDSCCVSMVINNLYLQQLYRKQIVKYKQGADILRKLHSSDEVKHINKTYMRDKYLRQIKALEVVKG